MKGKEIRQTTLVSFETFVKRRHTQCGLAVGNMYQILVLLPFVPGQPPRRWPNELLKSTDMHS